MYNSQFCSFVQLELCPPHYTPLFIENAYACLFLFHLNWGSPFPSSIPELSVEFKLRPVGRNMDLPNHAPTISWRHHLSLYSFSTPHLPPLTYRGLWSWPSWLRTALFKPWQRQEAVTRLLCRWTPLWLICRTSFECRPWASERSHDVIRVFIVFSVFWETIWNALESE